MNTQAVHTHTHKQQKGRRRNINVSTPTTDETVGVVSSSDFYVILFLLHSQVEERGVVPDPAGVENVHRFTSPSAVSQK
jgi:hypothetical protein